MKKKSITFIVLASIVLVPFLIAASIPAGHGLTSALDQNGVGEVPEGTEEQQELFVRTDLTGTDGPFLVGQPIFLQLSNDRTDDSGSPDLLYVGGASPSDVQVGTYRSEGPSHPWEPLDDPRAAQGALFRGEDDASSPSHGPTLIMMNFSRAGDFSLDVIPTNVTTGDRADQSAKVNVSVREVSYLFDVPTLNDRWTAGWRNMVATGEQMNFTISASTTDLWRATENWTTFYNWTVSVINPEGMVVGGNLSQYNTGDLRVSFDELNKTSVSMAWENGYNSVFYTVWDALQGPRFSGDAAMTPTGKEITYGSATRDAWTRGVWQPEGGGHITFHQAGHYLFVFTLTKNGQAVSPPLVQEVTVT